jgi:putative ABC transport system ATP-binding protein
MTPSASNPARSDPAPATPRAGTAPLIELENVGKVFAAADLETRALAGVYLTVRKGEFVAVAGPSGCGKSTLLSIIGLLDSPTEGLYRLDDQPVGGLSPARRAWLRGRKIGFVFQNFNLIADLTVSENVELPVSYQGVPPAERRRRAAEALERVGMSHRTRYYPSQLSGGQQQRVAVARALAGRPDIVLADEPTGNLDSKNGHAVMELLGGLNGTGTTVCVVTHDPRYAGYARRTVELLDGRVVNERSPGDAACAPVPGR